jgi:hypothetical protein
VREPAATSIGTRHDPDGGLSWDYMRRDIDHRWGMAEPWLFGFARFSAAAAVTILAIFLLSPLASRFGTDA